MKAMKFIDAMFVFVLVVFLTYCMIVFFSQTIGILNDAAFKSLPLQSNYAIYCGLGLSCLVVWWFPLFNIGRYLKSNGMSATSKEIDAFWHEDYMFNFFPILIAFAGLACIRMSEYSIMTLWIGRVLVLLSVLWIAYILKSIIRKLLIVPEKKLKMVN